MKFIPVQSLEELLAAHAAGVLWQNSDADRGRRYPRCRNCDYSAADVAYFWHRDTKVIDRYQRRDFAIAVEDEEE